MKKRLRKKKGKVIDSELWDLDRTICDWIIPRLKRFKQINIAYPGTPDVPTPEAWDEILDKMIKGFEMAKVDPIDLPSIKWDENNHMITSPEEAQKIAEDWNNERDEYLQLFAKYFTALWI